MPSERMSADTTEVSHHAAAASSTKLSVTISPLMRAVVDLIGSSLVNCLTKFTQTGRAPD
jgi:citrate lyase alpha subunit